MLISRIAASPSTQSLQGRQESPIGDRRGSLNHLWQQLQDRMRETLAEQSFTNSFNCQVLDASETDWVPSSVVITEQGEAHFHMRDSSTEEPYALLRLPQCSIIGHLGKSMIQVSGHTQRFLLKCGQSDFGDICATLLVWSRMRPAGLYSKLWYPPAPDLVDIDHDLLRCEVEAHFTVYNPNHSTWSPFLARLKRDGVIMLSNPQSQVSYSLDVRKVLSTRIKIVDPSVVDSNMVLLLFPDLGGPDSVYIRFTDIDDFEDWVATVYSLSMQPVATPLNLDPAQSVRWHRYITLKISSCRLKPEVENTLLSGGSSSLGGSSSGSNSLSETYIDICLSRWVFARTCVNLDDLSANWNQTFVLQGPELKHESTRLIPDQLELKLKKHGDTNIGGDKDITLGSHVLASLESQPTWQWLELDPTPFELNAQITQTEIPVLDYLYYNKLYDWMCDFNLRTPSRLVAAVPSALPKLITVFNEIFRAQGRQIEWVKSLASEEVKVIDIEGDTVFRESSLFTRSVEVLMQQQGGEILQKTIGRFVRKLVAGTEESLELDPSRGQDAAQTKSNAVAMRHFMNYLWSLIQSAGVPAGCTSIFRHMRSELALQKLSEDKLERVLHRAMSSLLFLRFYVPALLNPQVFNLTTRALEPSHRRTLMLVAKILQSFANRVKFGSKEQWLAPMNAFIEEHDESLVNWYTAISDSEKTSPQPLTIRLVNDSDVPVIAGDPPERPPKELPVEPFMKQQLTSPNLIDEWAAYAQLAAHVAAQDFKSRAHGQDMLVDEFIKECEFITEKQQEVIDELEKPDTFEESSSGTFPQLYLSHDTLLFYTDRSELDNEIAKAKPAEVAPRVNESSSRKFRTSKPASSDPPNEEVKTKSSRSVRKLTQMLRITKSSSSSPK